MRGEGGSVRRRVQVPLLAMFQRRSRARSKAVYMVGSIRDLLINDSCRSCCRSNKKNSSHFHPISTPAEGNLLQNINLCVFYSNPYRRPLASPSILTQSRDDRGFWSAAVSCLALP